MIHSQTFTTKLPLKVDPKESHAGLSSLFAAAVVSASFRDMLLKDPEKALDLLVKVSPETNRAMRSYSRSSWAKRAGPRPSRAPSNQAVKRVSAKISRSAWVSGPVSVKVLRKRATSCPCGAPALGQIGTTEAVEALQKRRCVEADVKVKNEIEAALEMALHPSAEPSMDSSRA